MGSCICKQIRREEECNGRKNNCTADSSAPWTYHSTRIQDMIEKKERDEFCTQVDADIAASEVHWSELESSSPDRHCGETNRKYFEELRRRKYVRKGDQIDFEEKGYLVGYNRSSLFQDVRGGAVRGEKLAKVWGGLVMGEKLAEGGQAEIYTATLDGRPYVVKVFKAGTVLQQLAKQIPPALLMHEQDYWNNNPERIPLPSSIVGATLMLGDERFNDRFAFLMQKHWGHLRKLIDQQMMRFYNQGPSFTPWEVLNLMLQIASQMSMLHKQRPMITHNDLKAANVLVNELGVYKERRLTPYIVHVVDYECSVGVVGTGAWRAPEILQQLKDGITPLKFTDKCDVYSYSMTCYEIVTGRIPFEGCSPYEARDLVLKGERLILPPDLDPVVEKIISSCWHHNPLERPSFQNIEEELREPAQRALRLYVS